MKGIEFKNKYPDIRLYKLTNSSEIHNDFQYKTGLNIDTVWFNPYGSCSPGGIYITEEENIACWVDGMVYYRKVTIPDNAKVYIENNSLKVDKVILSERDLIMNLPNEILVKSFVKHPKLLNYLIPREDLISEVLLNKKFRCDFKESNYDQKIYKIGIKHAGYLLEYIDDPSEEDISTASNAPFWGRGINDTNSSICMKFIINKKKMAHDNHKVV